MSVSQQLSKALKRWALSTQPVEKGELLTICGLERHNENPTIEDFFFGVDAGLASLTKSSAQGKRLFEIVDTNTLRNSFFAGIFQRHSSVRDIVLSFSLRGEFLIEASQSTVDKQPMVIEAINAQPPEGASDEPYLIQVPFKPEGHIAKDARLFWRAHVLEDGAEILDARWQARAPKAVEGRMVVALRTFGRTQDILDLLGSFNVQAETSEDYRRALRNICFVILDTSADLTPDSYDACDSMEYLQCFAYEGPNKGGGGNMSQVLLAIEDAVDTTKVDVDELLLLDDDLSITMETLYRHWASTLFRTDNTLFTLPVFRKTDPRRMWEDGGFWGRFLGDDCETDRAHFGPWLLRHNTRFAGLDHLDGMAKANYPEYCTFIFLSLPYAQFKKLGFPIALFLRGDDIEYSLRHNRTGGRILSNPNLAAWHEPAHSYGQEYMSISHGMMINMAYGQEDPDEYLNFFHKRAVAHMSLCDVAGLKLYTEVLRDLNKRDIFFEHGFKDHYVEKLGFFKAFDTKFEALPAEVLNEIVRKAKERGKHVVRCGFLYMPAESANVVDQVILENPHSDMVHVYRPYDLENVSAALEAAQSLYTELNRFAADFETIKAHYQERIACSATRDYWVEEMEHYSGGTRLLTQAEIAAE